MKKILILAGVVVAASANATLIYDNLNATGGTHSLALTTSTPRYTIADGVSTLSAGTGNSWLVDNIHIFPVFGVARTYSNVTARVRVYENWSASGTPEVFNTLKSDVSWGFGNVTITTANTYFNATLDYLANSLGFNLGSGQNMGFRVDMLENGVLTNDMTHLLSNDAFAPAVGTSSDGWYRDADANGLITSADARTFASTMDNMVFQINARAVPEPATLAVLGLGAAALIRRRKKA